MTVLLWVRHARIPSSKLVLELYECNEGPWQLGIKESACQCRRLRFDPWVRKIPWRRKWQPTPVFLPGKSHGQRSLAGYSPWGLKELDMTEQQKEVHTLDSQPSVIALLVLGPAPSVGLCPKIRSDSLGLCAWGCRRMTRSRQERELGWDGRCYIGAATNVNDRKWSSHQWPTQKYPRVTSWGVNTDLCNRLTGGRAKAPPDWATQLTCPQVFRQVRPFMWTRWDIEMLVITHLLCYSDLYQQKQWKDKVSLSLPGKAARALCSQTWVSWPQAGNFQLFVSQAHLGN